MKVLITGGAGFVGSHLADRLLADGHEVLVIDNYTTGRRDNLTSHANLKVVADTITDGQRLRGHFEKFRPDQVVHAAASYKDPDDWSEDIRTNVLGTANVVQAVQATGVKRLIYFQTALCYGIHPLQQPITLEHPIRPQGSSYAVSKTAGEQYIMTGGIEYISFRLANAYGPRNITGPLPTFFHRLTTGKPCFVSDTRRDFIYIDDLIEVVMAALDGKGRRGAYHVASGSDVAIKDLFDAAIKSLGIKLDKPVEVRPRGADDAFTILLDPTRTQHDFGWSVQTPLEEGVSRAIAYYRQFGIQQTYTHLKVA